MRSNPDGALWLRRGLLARAGGAAVAITLGLLSGPARARRPRGRRKTLSAIARRRWQLNQILREAIETGDIEAAIATAPSKVNIGELRLKALRTLSQGDLAQLKRIEAKLAPLGEQGRPGRLGILAG